MKDDLKMKIIDEHKRKKWKIPPPKKKQNKKTPLFKTNALQYVVSFPRPHTPTKGSNGFEFLPKSTISCNL